MDPNKISVSTFNELASLYAEKYMDVDLYNDTYDVLSELLPKAARVLELGAGPGMISRYLIRKRADLDIMATDASQAMLDIAAKQHPKISTQLLDCRELEKHGNIYEAVVAGFCLPYLSKEECIKLFSDVYACLSDQALFYLSIIDRDHQDSGLQTSKNTGRSVYQYYYREEDLEKMWAGNFSVLKRFNKSMQLADQTTEAQLILILRKNS